MSSTGDIEVELLHDLPVDAGRSEPRLRSRGLTGAGRLAPVAALLLAVLLLSPSVTGSTSTPHQAGPDDAVGTAGIRDPAAAEVAMILSRLDEASLIARDQLESLPADSRDAVEQTLRLYLEALAAASVELADASVSRSDRERLQAVTAALDDQHELLRIALRALAEADDAGFEAAVRNIGLSRNLLAQTRQELTSALGP